MTHEEMSTIATMVAGIMTSQKPQNAPQSASAIEVSPTVVSDTPVVLSPSEQAAEDHQPAIAPEQVADILNDCRLEVRVQKRYPMIEALEEAFKHPVATAVINGKKQPLISLGQMAEIVETLKKNGKYWPQVVTTILDQEGNRMYVNTSYKREFPNKWKLGSKLAKSNS